MIESEEMRWVMGNADAGGYGGRCIWALQQVKRECMPGPNGERTRGGYYWNEKVRSELMYGRGSGMEE